MNRLWISGFAVILSSLVGIAPATNCQACPPVAAAQATAPVGRGAVAGDARGGCRDG